MANKKNFYQKSYYLCITNNEIVQNSKIETKKILILLYLKSVVKGGYDSYPPLTPL